MSVTSEPLAVSELDPGALERPPRQVTCECVLEELARLCRVRHERPRVTQDQRAPRAGPLAGARLDLGHPRSRGLLLIDMPGGVGQIRNQPRTDHRVMC